MKKLLTLFCMVFALNSYAADTHIIFKNNTNKSYISPLVIDSVFGMRGDMTLWPQVSNWLGYREMDIFAKSYDDNTKMYTFEFSCGGDDQMFITWLPPKPPTYMPTVTATGKCALRGGYYISPDLIHGNPAIVNFTMHHSVGIKDAR